LRDRFPYPYTIADARNYLKANLKKKPETNFAIVADGNAVGSIGILLNDDVYRKSAEIGYWLGEEYWGRGIATRALSAITDYAISNYDLCRLYASVFEWNTASMRVLAKAGYTFEGRLRRAVIKDGKIIDQFLFAKTT